MKRIAVVLATGVVGLMSVAGVAPTADAATDQPVAVTPYAGFDPSLTRAPYVTDLTQTSADVTWATGSPATSAPGTLEWGTPGNCTANLVVVPSTLPNLVPVSGSPPSATSRQFTVNSVSEYQSTATISGLTAGTTYCYRVFTGGASPVDLLGTNAAPTFTTLDAVGSSAPLTFDVVGDLGETNYSGGTDFAGSLNTEQAAIDSLIGKSGARFVVTAGDVAYAGGTQTNYGDLQQTGTEVSNVFGPSYWPQTGGLPTFGVVGNHGQNVDGLRVWPESNTAAASSGNYDYASYPADSTDGVPVSTEPAAWYAISTGNVRIYVLDASWGDSNVGTSDLYQVDYNKHWTPSSPEYQWLAADLASHPGGVKMAVFHFPLRSDNSTQASDTQLQNSSANPNASTSLEALLAGNGVSIAFNGHAHTYQRINPHGAGQITNYVTGGGGGVLEPVSGGSTCSSLLATEDIYALGWSPRGAGPTSGSGTSCGPPGTPTPQSAADVYNFLKVTVTGTTVVVSPTNAAGQVFDPHTYTPSGNAANPSTPGSVTALALSPSSVQVAWSPSTESGGSIARYLIARDGSPVGTATGTSFVDTSARSGTTYTYSVTAVDGLGASSSPGLSNPVTTPGPPSLPFSGPPIGPVVNNCMSHLPAGSVVGAAALPDGSGYYEVDAQGDVAAFGGAVCFGAMTGTPLNRPIVGMAVDPATGGYWLVATDGGIFTFNAPFLGSTGGMHLNRPIVGMSPDRSGGGYWLVATDGGVFAFGNAPFLGSTGNIRLNQPIVGMAVDPATGGYWLVATDGGVFSFGGAPFLGSTGNIRLNRPIVGMAPLAGGRGYRLIASDGGVFDFNAPFYGSTGNISLNRPIIGGLDDAAGDGYWLIASDGGVFSYNAPFFGSAA